MEAKMEIVLWGESSEILNNRSENIRKVNGVHFLHHPKRYKYDSGSDKPFPYSGYDETFRGMDEVFADLECGKETTPFTSANCVIVDCSAVLTDVYRKLCSYNILSNQDSTKNRENNRKLALDYLTDCGTFFCKCFAYNWVQRYRQAVESGTHIVILTDDEAARFALLLLQCFHDSEDFRYCLEWADENGDPEVREEKDEDTTGPPPELYGKHSSPTVRMSPGSDSEDNPFLQLPNSVVSFEIPDNSSIWQGALVVDPNDFLTYKVRTPHKEFAECDYLHIGIIEDSYTPWWLVIKRPRHHSSTFKPGTIQFLPREIFGNIAQQAKGKDFRELIVQPAAKGVNTLISSLKTEAQGSDEEAQRESWRYQWKQIHLKIVGNADGSIPKGETPGIAVYQDGEKQKTLGPGDLTGNKGDDGLVKKKPHGEPKTTYELLLQVEKNDAGESCFTFQEYASQSNYGKTIHKLRKALGKCTGFKVYDFKERAVDQPVPIWQKHDENKYTYFFDFTVERCNSSNDL